MKLKKKEQKTGKILLFPAQRKKGIMDNQSIIFKLRFPFHIKNS